MKMGGKSAEGNGGCFSPGMQQKPPKDSTGDIVRTRLQEVPGHRTEDTRDDPSPHQTDIPGSIRTPEEISRDPALLFENLDTAGFIVCIVYRQVVGDRFRQTGKQGRSPASACSPIRDVPDRWTVRALEWADNCFCAGPVNRLYIIPPQWI